MSELEVQDSVDGALIVQYVPADAEGDSFVNDGRTMLSFIGPDTGWAIELETLRDCTFGDHPNWREDIAAPNQAMTTDFWNQYRFNDGSGRAQITYPGATGAVGIQVAAIRIRTQLQDDEA